MKLASVVLVVALSGCAMGQPTYQDISPRQLDAIATRLGTTVELLYREDRPLLRTEISESIGLNVIALELPDVDIPEGALPEDIIAIVKSEGVVAIIESATKAALKEVVSEGMKNPASKEGWIGGGIASLGILIAGALGMRGRRKRRKEAAHAAALANTV